MKGIMLTVAAALLLLAHAASAQQLEKAIFAGGCFWCVESDFDKIPGVVSTVSGYTGGKTAAQKQLDRPIVTPILPAAPFFAAEDYHQDYYKKNPVRYRYYRFSCGRNRRVKDVWGEHAYEGIPGHG